MRDYILFFILTVLILKYSNAQPVYSTITYDAGTSIEIQAGADVCATNININGVFSGSGTICSGALPVTISSFNASVNKNNVLLSWRTESEINNSGFRIERMDIKTNMWSEAGFVYGHGTTSEPKDYMFEDKKLQTSGYKYRLKQVDYNGTYEYYQLEGDVIVGKPGEFRISQNYPNPSNPKSKIEFEIPLAGRVTLKVYDILGKEVFNLMDENKEAGYYSVEFDGSEMASGVYFYRITAGKFSSTKKMLLIK